MKNIYIAFTTLAVLSVTEPAYAMDFLEKRECTVATHGRIPSHMKCIVSGGMSNGSMDVDVKTPDGKTYSLFGYLDRRDGWTMNNRPATQTSEVIREGPLCIRTLDEKIELCIGKKIGISAD